jgi:hypothetical protein
MHAPDAAIAADGADLDGCRLNGRPRLPVASLSSTSRVRVNGLSWMGQDDHPNSERKLSCFSEQQAVNPLTIHALLPVSNSKL